MNKKRQYFLSNIWQVYPESKSPARAGRFLGWTQINGLLHVSVEKHGTSQRYSVSSTKVTEELDWQEVLVPGDIIELVKDQIVLLVPTKSEWQHNEVFGIQRAKEWQEFLRQVRSFFSEKDFIALDTPSLVASPGMEVFLEAFETERIQGSKKEKLFLPTSPEFHLKKALCAGFEKIFEIAKVYRNNEDSPLHQNEFWMLEWYRAYDNLDSIKQDAKDLIEFVWGEKIHFVEKSFSDLFREYLSFELLPDTKLNDLKKLAENLKMDIHPSDDFDDLFFRIYVDHIEEKLTDYPWLILHSFPPSQAALSRKTKDGWADRFEIYARGIELANAFNELNDSEEQRKRFVEAQKEKALKDKDVYPVDEDFLSALEYGMPPSGGIAMGLDRLFMQLKGIKKIGETRLFPRY